MAKTLFERMSEAQSMTDTQAPDVVVTGTKRVTISAAELSKGLCTMICPQCLGVPSGNGICPLCSDGGRVIRTVEEAAKLLVPLTWGQIDKRGQKDTGDEAEDAHALGISEGFQQATQLIDSLTGGDGEYRYAMNGDPERHCPTPVEMIANIIDRLSTQSAMQSRLEELEAGLGGLLKWADSVCAEQLFGPQNAVNRARATLSNIGGSNGGR